MRTYSETFLFFQKNLVSCEVDLELGTLHKRKYFHKEQKNSFQIPKSQAQSPRVISLTCESRLFAAINMFTHSPAAQKTAGNMSLWCDCRSSCVCTNRSSRCLN